MESTMHVCMYVGNSHKYTMIGWSVLVGWQYTATESLKFQVARYPMVWITTYIVLRISGRPFSLTNQKDLVDRCFCFVLEAFWRNENEQWKDFLLLSVLWCEEKEQICLPRLKFLRLVQKNAAEMCVWRCRLDNAKRTWENSHSSRTTDYQVPIHISY